MVGLATVSRVARLLVSNLVLVGVRNEGCKYGECQKVPIRTKQIVPKSTIKYVQSSTKRFQKWYCWAVGVRSEGCEEGECGRNQWWPASLVGYTPPG